MLDVISGALGAFLIIVIILLPHYNKKIAEENQQLQEKLHTAEMARMQAEQEKKQAEQQLHEAREILKDYKQRLGKTFLVVLIKWKTLKQDIDLHIIDSSGAEFSYQNKTVPGRPGELSEDDREGPGIEVWEIRDAPPGIYKVYYNLYERNSNTENPVIEGRIFYRDGSEKVPDIELTQQHEKKPAANVTVKEDGNVEIQWI